MLAISTFFLLISLRAELCLAYSDSCFQVISLPALLPFSLFVKRTNKKIHAPSEDKTSEGEILLRLMFRETECKMRGKSTLIEKEVLGGYWCYIAKTQE